jgi:hypothetical protein
MYNLPSIITKIKSCRKRWEGHVACMREKRSGNRILVGKPEGKFKHRWEQNVKINFRETGWGAVD